MATLLQELLDVTSDLERNGIEYAVCGGLALAIHGFARATLDIDILILAENLEKAYQVAAKKGFDIKGLDMSIPSPKEYLKMWVEIENETSFLVELCLQIKSTKKESRFNGYIITTCLLSTTRDGGHNSPFGDNYPSYFNDDRAGDDAGHFPLDEQRWQLSDYKPLFCD